MFNLSRRSGIAIGVALLLCLGACARSARHAAGDSPHTPSGPSATASRPQPVLAEFRDRLPTAARQVSELARAADAAAERIVAHPLALISTPTAIQEGFADELANRAGGLSNVLYPELRPKEVTPHDVALFAVRSWEKDGPAAVKVFEECRAKGWLVIVLASAAGRPATLAADYFIDNGAPGPEEAHGRVNAIVNAMHGWMWCCEYVAAMTRRGKCPGVLLSVSYAKAEMYDAPLQASPGGRQWLGECHKPEPAGKLAGLYLDRVRRLAADLASSRTQEQIADAAEIIAGRLTTGRKVKVSGIGHLVMSEMMTGHPAGMSAFSPGDVKTSFKENLAADDLLFWIGYVGMDSAYAGYGAAIRETGADLIVCQSPDPDPSLNGPWAVARINQSWVLGDAEVPIPCPPGRMAPLSGVEGTLLLRMLDDEIACRLASMPATRPATQP